MDKKRSKEFDYNLYELLAKLREFDYRLAETNNKQTLVTEIDILILQAKAFIFDNKILEKEFLNRQKNFYKKMQTPEYKKRYTEIYEQIKEYVIKKSDEHNRKIEYFEAYSEKSYFMPFNVKVTDTHNSSDMFFDKPINYYFPSLRAYYKVFTKFPAIDDDNTNLKILPSLECFYLGIAPRINAIRVYNGTASKNRQEFLTRQKEFEDTITLIPKDLEFYIASGDYKTSPFFDCFRLSFYASSIRYVLNELQVFVQNLIIEKYYKNSDIPDFAKTFDNFKNHKEKLYKFFEYVHDNPKALRKQIAKDLNITDSSISKHCQAICDYFQLSGKKGIDTVREFAVKIPPEKFTS